MALANQNPVTLAGFWLTFTSNVKTVVGRFALVTCDEMFI